MKKLNKICVGVVIFGWMLFWGGSQASAQLRESTWEKVKATEKIHMAVFHYPPYFVKDVSTGKWGGALVAMVQDVAKVLKVEFVPVEVGGQSELVHAVATNKVDLAAGMQATPVRATAIDFAGPIYWIEWVTVNNPDFKGGEFWSHYNKPNVKVAVMTDTPDQLFLEQNAPMAEQLPFKELSQIILAVASGRADAFTTTVLSSMIAKEQNPDLGTFHSPKPRTALPSYFGIRSEYDPRFKNFLNWWAEWNNKLGYNEQRMKEGILKYSGLKSIPASVTFKE